MKYKSVIKSLRPEQWIKNLFIFSPLFFGGKLFDKFVFINTTISFVSFSLLASTIYLINDIADIKEDRIHSQKKYRPIASGIIKVKEAIALSIIIFRSQ